jgi:hypothetical protein
MIEALAIGRVSTKNQADNNHSLVAQRTNIDVMAVELEAEIIRRWEMAVSSRKGKNLKRKDLVEAKQLCRFNKNIKYILLDRVNRLGREAQYLTFYMLDLEINHGVRVIFCDPSQQELNGTDPKTFLKRVEKLVEGELENEERASLSNERMRKRVALGYYPFYPHQGYKKTAAKDGYHVPDEPRFTLLQKALKATASLEMTPKEAQLWLSANGYRTPVIYRKDKDGHKVKKGERILDLNHFTEIMKKSYYAGKIEIEGWTTNPRGLHKPMITPEELEINIAVANGRKIRRKQRYNPDFKLNLSFHESCMEKDGKMTGINHTNGKGWYRKEYLCRACKKRLPRDKVDDSMTSHLNRLVPSDKGVTALKEALKQVWSNKESYRIDRMKSLQARKLELGCLKSQMIHSLSANPDFGDDIKDELTKIKAEINKIDVLIAEDSNTENEFAEFAEFAIDYTEDLRKRWWELPGEKLQECKHLIFRSKIIVQPDGNVYTPDLSLIYSLQKKNDDPKVVENRNMVELAGTAPASARVAVHLSYRFSLFRVRPVLQRNKQTASER